MRTRRLSGKLDLAKAVATILAASAAACLAATITPQNGHSVQAYVNPFAGSTMTGGPYSSDGSSAIDLSTTYARQRGATDSAAAYFQFVRGAGPVTVASVLTYQYTYAPCLTPSPYAVKLGGTSVLTGGGAPGDKTWTPRQLSMPITTDTLRVDFGGLAELAANDWLGDMQNVMVFSGNLSALSPTVAANSPIYYSSEGGLPEMMRTNWTGYDGGWFPAAQTGPATRYFDLALGGVRNLGLILMQIESRYTGVSTIDLQHWTGSSWDTFATVSGASGNEYVPVLFPDGLSTGMIRFDAGPGTNANVFSHLLVFELLPVPEPGTLACLGLAALVLISRRRRRA